MLAFIAFALQSAFAATVHSGYSNDPNIVVPDSSALHWYDTKQVHTAYLVYKGPDPRPSSEPPPAANLYGPLIPFLPAGYHPSDIRTAYNITLNGSQAIAVVDFYHLATALTDFNTFSSTFGLPQETSTNSMASTNQVFQVVFQHPGIVPAVNQDWNGEEALDIEWTHAMAPNAKIYVVESDDGNLPACAAIAAALPGVKDVSCSFVWYYESLGATELQLDPDFTQPGVVFFASSGDLGGVPGWPSESPNVVSVGGTSLFMNSSNTSVLAETGWAGSGGGPSAYESRPAFQSSLASRIGPHRADPDISAIADPDTGVGIYTTSTLPADFGSGPWYVIGGTSLSSPVVAGIVNTTETWYPDSQAENGLIYSLLGTSKLRDIVFGSAGSFSGGPGWDFVTGCGSPLDLSYGILMPPTVTEPATPGGTVQYPLSAIDYSPSSHLTVGKVLHGPAWVTWNGTTLTISPPAGTLTGDYPLELYASDNGTPPLSAESTLMVRVAAAALSGAKFSSTVVAANGTAQLVVTLSQPAPHGGTVVSLASKSAYLIAPATFTIPEGNTTYSIPISSGNPPVVTLATVSVSYGTRAVPASIRIYPGGAVFPGGG